MPVLFLSHFAFVPQKDSEEDSFCRVTYWQHIDSMIVAFFFLSYPVVPGDNEFGHGQAPIGPWRKFCNLQDALWSCIANKKPLLFRDACSQPKRGQDHGHAKMCERRTLRPAGICTFWIRGFSLVSSLWRKNILLGENDTQHSPVQSTFSNLANTSFWTLHRKQGDLWRIAFVHRNMYPLRFFDVHLIFSCFKVCKL